jgi:hypothetical protein
MNETWSELKRDKVRANLDGLGIASALRTRLPQIDDCERAARTFWTGLRAIGQAEKWS